MQNKTNKSGRKRRLSLAYAKRERENTLENLVSHLWGGRSHAISYISELAFEHPDDPRFQALIDLLNDNPKLDLDSACREVKFPAADFLAELTKKAYNYCKGVEDWYIAVSHLIAGRMTPDVVASSYKEALRPGENDDRHYILQNIGFHPAPKGSSVTMINDTKVQQTLADLDLDFAQETRELHSILRGAVDEGQQDQDNLP